MSTFTSAAFATPACKVLLGDIKPKLKVISSFGPSAEYPISKDILEYVSERQGIVRFKQGSGVDGNVQNAILIKEDDGSLFYIHTRTDSMTYTDNSVMFYKVKPGTEFARLLDDRFGIDEFNDETNKIKPYFNLNEIRAEIPKIQRLSRMKKYFEMIKDKLIIVRNGRRYNLSIQSMLALDQELRENPQVGDSLISKNGYPGHINSIENSVIVFVKDNLNWKELSETKSDQDARSQLDRQHAGLFKRGPMVAPGGFPLPISFWNFFIPIETALSTSQSTAISRTFNVLKQKLGVHDLFDPTSFLWNTDTEFRTDDPNQSLEGFYNWRINNALPSDSRMAVRVNHQPISNLRSMSGTDGLARTEGKINGSTQFLVNGSYVEINRETVPEILAIMNSTPEVLNEFVYEARVSERDSEVNAVRTSLREEVGIILEIKGKKVLIYNYARDENFWISFKKFKTDYKAKAAFPTGILYD